MERPVESVLVVTETGGTETQCCNPSCFPFGWYRWSS
jgi:hypothetical protein